MRSRSHWITGFLGKTNIQAFNDILDAAILSVPVCSEDVEVMESFTYLDSDTHVSADCKPEVNRCLGRALLVMDSLDHGGVALPVPVWEDENPSLQVLGNSSLALWM